MMRPAPALLTDNAWSLADVLRNIDSLRSDMLRTEEQLAAQWTAVPVGRRESARNLVHYLAMRARDLRPPTDELARIGLSSLGRAERGAFAIVDAVSAIVRRLAGDTSLGGRARLRPIDLALGPQLLLEHLVSGQLVSAWSCAGDLDLLAAMRSPSAMQAHQHKKTAMLRGRTVANRFLSTH